MKRLILRFVLKKNWTDGSGKGIALYSSSGPDHNTAQVDLVHRDLDTCN